MDKLLRNLLLNSKCTRPIDNIFYWLQPFLLSKDRRNSQKRHKSSAEGSLNRHGIVRPVSQVVEAVPVVLFGSIHSLVESAIFCSLCLGHASIKWQIGCGLDGLVLNESGTARAVGHGGGLTSIHIAGVTFVVGGLTFGTGIGEDSCAVRSVRPASLDKEMRLGLEGCEQRNANEYTWDDCVLSGFHF